MNENVITGNCRQHTDGTICIIIVNNVAQLLHDYVVVGSVSTTIPAGFYEAADLGRRITRNRN